MVSSKVQDEMRTVDLVPPSLFTLLFGAVVAAEELHIPPVVGLTVLAMVLAAMIASAAWSRRRPSDEK